MPDRTSSSRAWRVAVVGGGLAGLSAAFRLNELCERENRQREIVLFESSARLGGVVGTRRIEGYQVELGADSFITNKPWAVDLCRRLGIEDRLIPTDSRYRRSLVLREARPVPVPEGFQLLAPVSVGAVLGSPIFSWGGKLRLALEYFVPRGRGDGDESLASFVRRRFGREALERLVQPLVGGIYTADPERLSLRATMPRFLEMEREHGSLIRALRRQQRAGRADDAAASGARYGLFTAPREGIAELVDALAGKVVQQAAVRHTTEVFGMARAAEGRAIELEISGGAKETFDAVVVAIPAHRAAGLVRGVSSAAAENLRQIEYASTAIVVSGHKLADIEHPLDAFGLVVPAMEKRRILAVSFASRKFAGRAPEGCVELRTFVGGAMQPELMRLSDDEITAVVRDELAILLGVHWKPDFVVVARWMQSMPQYHVGHLGLVESIERELSAMPNLALAGNAYHGVGIPDTIHSGEMAAERVFPSSHLAPPR